MNDANGALIAAVRRFNRFYTRQIGLLEEGLLKSAFSLTESRVLYELANRDAPTATDLTRDLGLDAGYLSRILRGFEARGLIDRIPSANDGRQHHLQVTEGGRAAFAPLDRASQQQVGAMVDGLGEDERARLTQAMGAIEQLMGSRPADQRTYLLRPHRPGDMGYVVGRHGAVYAQEYGWDITFEALVAEIVAQFVRNFDARRECCLIAEIDGSAVGSVFVVRHTDRIAKLRLLLVEPSARNTGLGGRLVAEAVRFARAAGYAEMTLWTQSILTAARSIYQKAGFRLIKQAPHTSFGQDLIGETWERTL
jgi:DNA-binding MarR family transcriptional regulator/N-acetylglutamate synthase-like GNAT family acetyltransferase